MKYFVALFAVVFVVAFGGTTLASGEICSDGEMNKITTCYKAVYGDSVTLQDIMRALDVQQMSKAYWKPFCADHQKLNECMGKDLIQKCFNVPSISKLPIPLVDQYARFLIAASLHMDLVCDEFLKFSDEDVQCLAAKWDTAKKECRRANSCAELSEAFKCAVKLEYKCGNKIGCFMKKLTTLATCSMTEKEFNCPECDKISYSNNLIDGICED